MTTNGLAHAQSSVAALNITMPAQAAQRPMRIRPHSTERGSFRKHSPNSARKRIFDGAAEAKLIALACSKPPEGFAKWTLRLLEESVVELNIVDRASDNTIGRTLKKTNSGPICKSSGSPCVRVVAARIG